MPLPGREDNSHHFFIDFLDLPIQTDSRFDLAIDFDFSDLFDSVI
jgi:hypothetical protein